MEISESEVEKKRLLELYSMNVLQLQPDTVLDTFCEKVANLFDVPSCVVSIVWEDRQWFKSSFGCPVELAQARETPRDISFCTHVVDTEQPLIVQEVSKDPRFANNPLVKKYGFGFYAGFPLKTRKGYVLGSLCLYDNKPREFSKREVELLGLFSERVMAHLELCRELEHVRASESRFRSIAESAHDGLVVMGEDEQIIEINSAAERMFGWTREELLGQSVKVLMPQRYRQRHRESVTRFIERGTSDKFSQPRQFEAVRRDGTEFPIEISISGFKVAGKWTFTAFIREITDRKLVEEALRESEDRYHTLAKVSPVGIFRTDAQGNCIYVNERWCEITGLIPDEALGAMWAQGLHPDDRERVFAEWSQACKEGLQFRSEYRFQRPDGITTWVLGQAVAERGNKGACRSLVGVSSSGRSQSI